MLKHSCHRISSVLLVLFCVLVSLTPLNAQMFKREQVLEDINFAVKALKRNHPNLYAHRTPKEFAAIVKTVKNSVTDLETYVSTITKIQKIMAAVCDEHTSVKLDYKNDFDILERKRVLAEHLNAGLESVEIEAQNINRANETLDSINDHDSEKIRNHLSELVSADGCANKGILMTRHLQPFQNLILADILNVERHYTRKSHTPDDKNIRTNVVSSYSFEESISSFSKKYLLHRRTELLENVNIPFYSDVHFWGFKPKDLGISVFSTPDKSIYYIYSHSFRDGQLQMKRTNKLLRDLIRSKPKHVILDLTDNPGGQLKVASHLLSYFLNKSHRIASHIRMRNSNSRRNSRFTFAGKKRAAVFCKNCEGLQEGEKTKGAAYAEGQDESFWQS